MALDVYVGTLTCHYTCHLNEDIEAESELEHGAKFALAVFRALAQKAVEAGAPMLLDV